MGYSEDLEQIARQQKELVLPRLDAAVAWELGTTIRALAVERQLPVVIDIRRFGQQLFYTALEGTTPDNPEWVRRKSNLVARFLSSSYAIGQRLKLKDESIEKNGLTEADYAPHGGSFPLTVPGAGVIGSVTVSGITTPGTRPNRA